MEQKQEKTMNELNILMIIHIPLYCDLVTNSLTDSSSLGFGSMNPKAPRPALIFPGHVNSEKVGKSARLPGNAY